ncbi:MAG: tRNA guanosine(34) transglycosylase Tgt, partial [bacterium]|nr:tRNA guanosine(34) transglycosylase Tgt [bacterium]
MQGFSFEVKKREGKVRARVGVIQTPHGTIETPAYSPVATRATVKALDVADLKAAGSQVLLGNAYHLYLRPGLEILEKFGGFAPFMGWENPTITDSGGYQVSFLWAGTRENRENKEKYGRVVKITDEGALFTSHIDGSKYLLTPEKSMEIQKVLRADIIMAFDQPIGLDYSEKKKNEAFKRTLKWEERSFVAWEKQNSSQALFGIVQGGENQDLTRECLKFLLGFSFPGLAVGGEAIGVDPLVTARTLDGVADLLPDDKPLHALGLGGGPEGIFEAVERGVDLFDNSSITRMARNGLLLLYPEDGGKSVNKFRFDINKSKFKDDKNPISKICFCHTCQNYSKAYLH